MKHSAKILACTLALIMTLMTAVPYQAGLIYSFAGTDQATEEAAADNEAAAADTEKASEENNKDTAEAAKSGEKADAAEKAEDQKDKAEEADDKGAHDKEATESGSKKDKSSKEDADPEDTDKEENKTSTSLAYEGKRFDVSIDCTSEAGLPENTDLTVEEITSKDKEYKDYYKTAVDALRDDADKKDTRSVRFVRLYDMTLTADGKTLEPDDTVNVTIDYTKSVEADKALTAENPDNVKVLHFTENKKTGELEAEVLKAEATGATVDGAALTETSFEAESFSVYAVVYTVDFHYGDGEYDFSIAGESSILLSEVLERLHIGDLTVNDVKAVKFSDPKLIKVEKEESQAQDGTGTLVDWKLTSLKAFDTEETLTLTLRDGSKVVIGVTDAEGDPVIRNTGNNRSYTSLKAAIDDIGNAGATLEVLGSFTVDEAVTFSGGNLTLKAASGVTPMITRGTGATGDLITFNKSGSTLTINGINFDGNKDNVTATGALIKVSAGNISLTNTTIQNHKASTNAPAVNAFASSNVSIYSGVKIIGNENADGAANFAVSGTAGNVKIYASLTEDIGISSVNNGPDKQFAFLNDASYTGLDHLKNDYDSRLTVVPKGNNNKQLYWSEAYVCRIVEGDTYTEYSTLLAAITYINGYRGSADTLYLETYTESIEIKGIGAAKRFGIDNGRAVNIVFRTCRDAEKGLPAGKRTVIKKSENGHWFHFYSGDKTITIEDIVFDGQGDTYSTGTYGMIGYINGNVVLGKDFLVRNCKSTGNGGAFCVESGSNSLKMTDNARAENCVSDGLGGFVHIHDGHFCSFECDGSDVVISNCSANQGGAIYNQSDKKGAMKLEGEVTFANCTAKTGKGGAIYSDPDEAEIQISGESSFTNCTAATSGGAIYFKSDNGKLIISGNGSLSGNTAAQHGGAIYAVVKNGSIEISENASLTNNTCGYSGSAIYAEGAGSKIVIKDNAEISNNTAGDNGPVNTIAARKAKGGGAVMNFDADVSVEGSPYIRENLNGNGSERNVVIPRDNTLTVTGDLTGGEIGIYCADELTANGRDVANAGYYKCGDQFGVTVKANSLDVVGLNILTNDRTAEAGTGFTSSSPRLVGVPGEGNKVRWYYVCQIVKNGVFQKEYGALEDAFKAVNDGDYTGDLEIQMLISAYQCYKASTLSNSGTTTLTTTDGSVGYAYQDFGRNSNGKSTVYRGYNGDSLITVSSGNFTTSKIVLDGHNTNIDSGDTNIFASSAKGGLIQYNDANGTLNITTNSTLRNSTATAAGGAINLANGADLTMPSTITNCSGTTGGGINAETGDSTLNVSGTISNCTASSGNGGGIAAAAGTTLNMSTGSITGNSAQNGAGVYTAGTFNMSGGSIIGNTATAGGGVGVDGATAKLYFSDSAVVTGNTMSGSNSNVYLDADDNEVINVKSGGLGTAANIGVYVPDGTALYDKHGAYGKPFGTYAGSTDNLDKFVNDRNNSTGVAKTVDSKSLVYWAGVPVVINVKGNISSKPILPSATFTLKDSDDNTVWMGVSDNEGKITIPWEPTDTEVTSIGGHASFANETQYTLEETATVNGYIRPGGTWTLTGGIDEVTCSTNASPANTNRTLTITREPSDSYQFTVLNDEEPTITYDANGGTFTGTTPETVDFTNTETSHVYTVTSTVPTRNGKSFGGWYDNASGTGDPITEITVFRNQDNKNFQTLYAKWIDGVDLTISKSVTGAYANMSRDYAFTITLPNTAGVTYKAQKTGDAAPVDITLGQDGKYTFTLVNNESITFSKVPVGQTVTVTETDIDMGSATGEDGRYKVGIEYTPANSVEDATSTPAGAPNSASFKLKANSTVAFTNTLDNVPSSGISLNNWSGRILFLLAIFILAADITYIIWRRRSLAGHADADE